VDEANEPILFEHSDNRSRSYPPKQDRQQHDENLPRAKRAICAISSIPAVNPPCKLWLCVLNCSRCDRQRRSLWLSRSQFHVRACSNHVSPETIISNTRRPEQATRSRSTCDCVEVSGKNERRRRPATSTAFESLGMCEGRDHAMVGISTRHGEPA